MLQHEWIKGPWSWCGKAAFSSLSLISYSSTSVVVPLWKLEAVKSPRCTHCTLPGHRELPAAAYCSRRTWTFVLLGSSFGLILGPRCRGSQFDPLLGTSLSSGTPSCSARRAARNNFRAVRFGRSCGAHDAETLLRVYFFSCPCQQYLFLDGAARGMRAWVQLCFGLCKRSHMFSSVAYVHMQLRELELHGESRRMWSTTRHALHR